MTFYLAVDEFSVVAGEGERGARRMRESQGGEGHREVEEGLEGKERGVIAVLDPLNEGGV